MKAYRLIRPKAWGLATFLTIANRITLFFDFELLPTTETGSLVIRFSVVLFTQQSLQDAQLNHRRRRFPGSGS